jgi:hypothetical protein
VMLATPARWEVLHDGEVTSLPARGDAIHPIRVMPSVRQTDSMRTEGGR